MLCVNPGAGGKGGLDGKVETSELTVQTIQALVKDFCFLLQLNAEILALQAPITGVESVLRQFVPYGLSSQPRGYKDSFLPAALKS